MPAYLTIFWLLMTISLSTLAGTKVAVVKLIRGSVNQHLAGKVSLLKVDDWVEDGSVVKTADKSFVKLVFIDKSQMNVGPNSEMKIEKFSDKDSGVIDLVKGKIRSQVTKDYLQMDKEKSKMFIKTANAVMGIRGTDFMIATNGKTTSAVLFEGEVVFNRLDARSITSSAKLEEIVDRGVRMFPGEFSVMEQNRIQPTVPALMNVQQRESLEKNESFDNRSPGSSLDDDAKKSVVPEGLTGQAVSNSPDTLKEQIATVVPAQAERPLSSSAEGYVSGDSIKPTNGSFLHVDSGIIIPPGPGSVLDQNSNTYIPGSGNGMAGDDGNYIPPKNVQITADGKMMVAVIDANGSMKMQEMERPVPVMTATTISLTQVGQVIAQNPTLINPARPITNDILNTNFAPTGLNDLSNLQKNVSGGIILNEAVATQKTIVPTTIVVKPAGN